MAVNTSYSLWIDGLSLEELRKYTYGLYGRLLSAEQAQWNTDLQLRKLRSNGECPSCKDTGVIGPRALAEEPCPDCGGASTFEDEDGNYAGEHEYGR